jgi:two-component system OmpR family sensor kinase
MRQSLFWKILLGFWLTFVTTTAAVWGGITLLNNSPPPQVREQLPGVIQITSAMIALRTGGPAAVEKLEQRWPPQFRRQLSLARMTAAPEVVPALPGEIVVISEGAEGTRYRLTYRPSSPPAPLPFNSGLVIPLGILALWAVGGMAFAALLAWYLTHPITRLRGGFDRLAHGDLAVRLKPVMGRRRDEIADLARDFDAMAERLQALVGARDRLLHDVSHELRSPLARLNMAVGLARQKPERVEETLTRIENETGRLDVLVGELLTLSRVESGDPRLEGYFEIEGLVRTVVADARFEADASGVQVTSNVDAAPAEGPRPTVKGDAELMRRAIENIVRNALRFSARGQSVDVGLEADAKARHHILRVSDEGPGVPPEGLATMFEPFVRLHGAASGAGYGLGLAIARRTILVHGGFIEARNRPGRGLVVTVRLPFGPPS